MSTEDDVFAFLQVPTTLSLDDTLGAIPRAVVSSVTWSGRGSVLPENM